MSKKQNYGNRSGGKSSGNNRSRRSSKGRDWSAIITALLLITLCVSLIVNFFNARKDYMQVVHPAFQVGDIAFDEDIDDGTIIDSASAIYTSNAIPFKSFALNVLKPGFTVDVYVYSDEKADADSFLQCFSEVDQYVGLFASSYEYGDLVGLMGETLYMRIVIHPVADTDITLLEVAKYSNAIELRVSEELMIDAVTSHFGRNQNKPGIIPQ